MTPVNNNNAVIQGHNSESINIRDHITNNGIENKTILFIHSMTNIRTLPESLGNEQDIETIYIVNTPIESLPKSIQKIQNLQQIILINTKIKTLPESIGNVSNLKHLTISKAPIASLPDSIGNLHNLQQIILINTKIKTLPESIGNVLNLKYLTISKAPIASLPDSIGNLHNLQQIILINTEIKILPESIGNVLNLKYLTISKAPIASLPDSIGNLHNLFLCLSDTQIATLPNTVTILSKIISDPEIPLSSKLKKNLRAQKAEEMGFTQNRLGGSPPDKLASLPDSILKKNLRAQKAEEMGFTQNRLGGSPPDKLASLPDSIGNLHNLSLCLSDTQITTLQNTILILSKIISHPEIPLSSKLGKNLRTQKEERLARLKFSPLALSNANAEEMGFTQIGGSQPDKLARVLYQLYNSMNKPTLPFTHIKNIPDINQWIVRLVGIPENISLLLEILEYAEENSSFRKRLALNIKESLSSNDFIYYFTLIYMEKKLSSIDPTNSSEFVNFLLHIAFLTNLISDIVKQRIKINLIAEQRIEIYSEIAKQNKMTKTYLVYFTDLNEKLKLRPPITNMQSPEISQISEEDIEIAKEFIRNEMSNPNKYIPFLIKHDVWIEFLKTTYPKGMKEITDKSINIEIENAENAEVYRDRHLALLTENYFNNVNEQKLE